jgi:hypothetical protein
MANLQTPKACKEGDNLAGDIIHAEGVRGAFFSSAPKAQD